MAERPFTSWIAAAALVASGCTAAAGPRLVWQAPDGPATDRPATAVAAGLVTRAPGVRLGPWGESPEASFLLREATAPEEPHIHRNHDLTVVLLRGRGVLHLDDGPHPLTAGDVVHVARGRLHWFESLGHDPALGLAIYTPQMVGQDFEPASSDKR